MALALQPDGRILISDDFTGLWRVNGDPIPWLRDLSRDAAGLGRFGLQTQPGETVVVETSTNLIDWRPWTTNVAADCHLAFTNNLPNEARRFFRAVQVLP